jgi:hypothetical protein
MTTLPDERILLESDSKTLVLTTHRVRFKSTGSGKDHLISIMLEEVASCQASVTSRPMYLILAGAFLLVGLGVGSQQRDGGAFGVVVLAVSALFGVLYFTTRGGVLAINSAKGSIRVPIRGKSLKAAEEFVDALERAKHERLMLLAGSAKTATSAQA